MIEGFHIQNFRALKDVKLGKLWKEQNKKPLTPLTVVIGKNGAGKSSLFDAFGFLADALKYGVEEACDMNGRGGFERIRSKENDGPIYFEIYFRESPGERPITYELTIDLDENHRPIVFSERLRQRRKNQKAGRPFSFLILNKGRGIAWCDDAEGSVVNEDKQRLDDVYIRSLFDKDSHIESGKKEWVELEDAARLGIATLGALKQHPRISVFRKFIEDWYLSYFSPDSARSLPLAGPQKRLSVHGDNLGNVVQFMQKQHSDKLQKVLDEISNKIPEIEKIDTLITQDKRLLLRFKTQGFDTPFYAQQMSDGTLKLFTYLLLLASPFPAPFVCIEEPENGLYPKLLATLASEFRGYAMGKKNRCQVFVTTHQPYLVDSLNPDEVWILEKQLDGFSSIRRASDNPLVINMVKEELPLGCLWISDFLDD